MSDLHEENHWPDREDDGGCRLDPIATRLDVSELPTRIEGRRRSVSVIWVEPVIARTDALDALQRLIDTPGLLDRDSAIRARRTLMGQMHDTPTEEWA